MKMHQERAQAVKHLVDQAREIEKTGVTYTNLGRIGDLLAALANRAELFPADEFPLGSDGGIYRLAEDPDHRFALYASAGAPGKYQPPHNHTTWAVISSVFGDEHNIFFERTDDGSTPDVGKLRKGKEVTVSPGTAVSLMPDDIHCIRVINDKPSLHLHFYGLSLEFLPNRVFYESEEGGRYKVFPPSPITKVA